MAPSNPRGLSYAGAMSLDAQTLPARDLRYAPLIQKGAFETATFALG